MYSALSSIGVFGFLTISYFLAKFFFIDRKGPPVPSGTGATILSLMYVVLVVGVTTIYQCSQFC